MAISNAIHLLAGSCGIGTVGVRNESKSLCSSSVPVLGQKYASDPSEPLKHIPKFILFGKLGYIGDTKRSEVIALAILAEAGASHAFPSAGTSFRITQMRGNVSAAGLLSQGALVCSGIRVARCRSGSSGIVERREGILVRASRGEMIALTDTTGHLLVLELVLEFALGRLVLLLRRLPICGGPEDNVFADRGGGEVGSGRAALFLAEFGPFFALGDAGVDVLFYDSRADLAGRLDFLVAVGQAIRDYCLGSVRVGDDLLRREGGGVIELFVVGPVRAAEIKKRGC